MSGSAKRLNKNSKIRVERDEEEVVVKDVRKKIKDKAKTTQGKKRLVKMNTILSEPRIHVSNKH